MHVLDRTGGLWSDAELQRHATFMDLWLGLLLAAAQKDRDGCLCWSLELGYLTGKEIDVGRSIRNFLPFCDIWLMVRLDHG